MLAERDLFIEEFENAAVKTVIPRVCEKMRRAIDDGVHIKADMFKVGMGIMIKDLEQIHRAMIAFGHIPEGGTDAEE